MIEFINTITIARPIGETFAYLADFESIPQWNYYVLSVRKISDAPVGIGTVYHQVRKTDEQSFRMIEFEPNERIAIQTLPGSSPKFEIRFTLHAEGTSTHITDEWKLDTGQLALLDRLTAGRVRAAVGENLTKLKELLETGRVTLQDGRESILHRTP